MKQTLLLNLLAFLLACVLGCSFNSTGTVTGTVTFEGQPIEQGLITFSPSGAEGGTAGSDIVLGKYTVTGLKPAKYLVTVEATKEPKFTAPGDPANNRTKTDAEIHAQHDPLPRDTQGKEQQLDVKGGEQVLDFKLTSPSKTK